MAVIAWPLLGNMLFEVRTSRMRSRSHWYGIECCGRGLDRSQSLRLAAKLRDLIREETITDAIADLQGGSVLTFRLSGYRRAISATHLNLATLVTDKSH